MTRHVVLLGPMGSGKTSIGKQVAKSLRRPLVDGDVELEERTGGRTAADVADTEGIDALHRMEADIALQALSGRKAAVVGPAASVIEVPEVRELLKEHLLVWFTGPAEHFAERAVKKSHRPLLDDGDPVELFRRQLATREPLARPLAALVIDVAKVPKRAAAAAIVAAVRGRA